MFEVNSKRVLSLGLVAAFLAAAGLLWFIRFSSRMNAPSGAPPEMQMAIQTARVSATEWTPMADLVGTVVPYRAVALSNEVEGRVILVNFDTGGIVEPDQILLELDASTELADLSSAQAGLVVAQAAARVADADVEMWESNLRRIEPAVAARAAPAADLDQARSQLTSARARVDSAKALIRQAESRIEQAEVAASKKVIRAPFKARAGIRAIHEGQYLAQGTRIVDLQGVTDRIFLDFAIPQEYAQSVKPGDVVVARSAMLGSEAARIEVVGIDAVVNPDTRNVRIRAVVDNPDDRLKPGMFVDISVASGPTERVLTIPSTAVRRAAYGDHVFVIAPDDKGVLRAGQRFVTLGASLGDSVIVLKGISEADTVATDGSFKLFEGVRIAAPEAAAK
jgi:membrane fusion protein (multidrug efflux system)